MRDFEFGHGTAAPSEYGFLLPLLNLASMGPAHRLQRHGKPQIKPARRIQPMPLLFRRFRSARVRTFPVRTRIADEAIAIRHPHLRQSLRIHHFVLSNNLVERENVGRDGMDLRLP